MANRWANGKFGLAHPEKYVGTNTPTFRSSWEWQFMQFCDTNPNIIQWSSESVRIPYRNPFTGKPTIYVPDFLVVYMDKTGQKRAELVEVKPSGQTEMKFAKTTQAKATVLINMAKWEAARKWCAQQHISFRIITEAEIFKQGKKR